jgi:hypothetical protein
MPLATATAAGISAKMGGGPRYLSPMLLSYMPELVPVWERLAEPTRLSPKLMHCLRARRDGRASGDGSVWRYLDGQALPHLHRHLISKQPQACRKGTSKFLVARSPSR